MGQSERIGHGDGAGEEVMVRSERRGDGGGGASACFPICCAISCSFLAQSIRVVWCGVVWAKNE